jgi:hypothetical protein
MEPNDVNKLVRCLVYWQSFVVREGFRHDHHGQLLIQHPDLVRFACIYWMTEARTRYYGMKPNLLEYHDRAVNYGEWDCEFPHYGTLPSGEDEVVTGTDWAEVFSQAEKDLEKDWSFFAVTLALAGFADERRLRSDGIWELLWQTSVDDGPPCEFFQRAPQRDSSARISRELYLRIGREVDQISLEGFSLSKEMGSPQSSTRLSKIVPNDSFNCIRWGKQTFEFSSGAQADSVKTMYAAWLLDVRWISQKEILAKAEVDGERLRDKFKRHEAWGTMIVKHPEKNDLYGLADPPDKIES